MLDSIKKLFGNNCQIKHIYFLSKFLTLVELLVFILCVILYETGVRATSCKKSIRKNKSTRTDILYLKMSVRVDLFFLVDLFFPYWLLHEAALSLIFKHESIWKIKIAWLHFANCIVWVPTDFLALTTRLSPINFNDFFCNRL